MRAHIEHNPFTRGVNIWLSEDMGGRTCLVRLDRDGLRLTPEELRPGATLPDKPTLALDGDVWEAIVREVGKVTQSSDATVDALADTRGVRDRLLTLIERSYPA